MTYKNSEHFGNMIRSSLLEDSVFKSCKNKYDDYWLYFHGFMGISPYECLLEIIIKYKPQAEGSIRNGQPNNLSNNETY